MHAQIQLSASGAVTETLEPLVVLDAAVFFKEELEDQVSWQTLPGFGEGSIPGFNSFGRAVMLVKSAQLPVKSIEDMGRAGVTTFRLPTSQD
jgi:hypothetical protein